MIDLTKNSMTFLLVFYAKKFENTIFLTLKLHGPKRPLQVQTMIPFTIKKKNSSLCCFDIGLYMKVFIIPAMLDQNSGFGVREVAKDCKILWLKWDSRMQKPISLIWI